MLSCAAHRAADGEVDESSAKLAVLMVHDFYRESGGEDVVFRNEVEMLRKRGHRVVEYTMRNDAVSGVRGILIFARSLIWNRVALKEVRRIIRDNDIDVVHCHNLFPLISPSVFDAARDEGVPVFQTVHNFRYICPGALLFRDGHYCDECVGKGMWPAIKHRCYRHSFFSTIALVIAAKCHSAFHVFRGVNFIFLSDLNKEKHAGFMSLQECGGYVKPNCASVPSSAKIIGGSVPYSKVFVFIGRLEPEKGVADLLGKWPEAKPEGYRLEIIGDGSLRGLVEDVAGSRDDVIFRGPLTHDEAMERLSRCCALVFPSLCFETFGMTLAEAFSLGVPAVVRRAGNAAALVDASGAGICYGSHPGELAQALREVAKNRSVYSGRGRSYSSMFFSPEANYRLLLDIYGRQVRFVDQDLGRAPSDPRFTEQSEFLKAHSSSECE